MGHFLTTPVLRALTGEAFKRLNLQPDTYPAVELYKKIQKLVKISFQLWEPADQTPLCHICTPTVSGPCSSRYLFYSSFLYLLIYCSTCTPGYLFYSSFFIGPEFDHSECLSLTHSLPNSLTPV